MAERAHDTTGAGVALAPEQVALPDALLENTAHADTRHGRMWYPPQDDPIGRALSEYGEWAVAELRLLALFATPGSTVVDVGANIGTHTLSLARSVTPTGCVVAIEPQPLIFALLAQNVRANQLHNVRLVNACGGAKPGFAEVPALDLSGHHNFGAVAPRLSEDEHPGTVPVIAFDSLRLRDVSLIKIDVEGTEALVLSGASRTIDEQRPVIYFEANDLDHATDAVRFLQGRNYQMWLHRAPAFNPENYRAVPVNTFGFATETNVLAIPAERVESSRPLLVRDDLFPFVSLDELAALLSESPRYDDPSPDHRSLGRLREALSEARAHAAQLEAAHQERQSAWEQQAIETSNDLANLRQNVVRSDLRHAQAVAQVAQQEEDLSELKQQVGQFERHVAELNRQLAKRGREVRKLKSELTQANDLYESERMRGTRAEASARRAAKELERLRNTPAVRLAGSLRQLSAKRIAKLLARRARHARERTIIEASGLFDEKFYATQHPAADPLGHYLAKGAASGLDPTPLFDTSYYLERYPEVAKSVDNAFAHYLKQGAADGGWPNPHFDPNYYVSQHPRLSLTAVNPLIHFVSEGAAAGRRPNPNFDPGAYLAGNPAVKASGENPLANYIRASADKALPQKGAEAWVATPAPSAPTPGQLSGFSKAPPVTLPTPEEWRQATPHAAVGAAIDVIVPVYRGQADTLRCIHRVLTAQNRTPFELIVIDDCSPDPELTTELQRLAAEGMFTYLRNARNLGFVGSVNRGFSLHPDRDVLLLNSDTEVFNDWLDRMCNVARTHARVGTLTPFSNNATICSYPTFARDNDMLLELPYQELDLLASRSNAGQVVELPTGVGFCMYIARACLNEIGPFDQDLFGRGYGEENDFCRRAMKRGWKNLMACDVFVRHTGGASFQGERVERVALAMKILDAVHPDYQESVRTFIREDPIGPLRARMDVERARRALGEHPLAIVSHSRGGGTERHVQQLVTMARQENVGVLMLRPSSRSPHALTMTVEGAGPFPNLPSLLLEGDPEAAAKLLNSIGVRHMHVHHLVDLAAAAPRWVEGIARSGRLTIDYTIHDYSPICPRINLIDQSGIYCGEPSESECDRCIAKLGSSYGIVAIAPFRKRYRTMLGSVRRVFVPSDDVKLRLLRYFPELRVVVRPHPESPANKRSAAEFRSGERLRVAVIGAIGPNKGYDLLIRCSENARRRSLPLDYVVVGFTRDDARARRAGIEITGSYSDDEQALQMLEHAGAHVSFFPAVWPETYSYTLSLSLDAGLYPIAFDLGAIAERLRRLGTGTVLPLEAMRDPARVNDALLELTRSALPTPAPLEPRSYTLADYYDDCL